MDTIHLKKGYAPNISGVPDSLCKRLNLPQKVAMVPERIPFIKPRLLVEEGDTVAIGSPLFEDKRESRIRFLSPGGGKVTRITFGPRRVIEQIIISLDNEEQKKTFDLPPFEKVETADRKTLITAMLEGGMWPFLRALPFFDMADPDTDPPSILVRLGDDEPFSPSPAVYLAGREAFFHDGITLLLRLCENVSLHLAGDETIPLPLPDQVTIRRFIGRYPTGNPGVQLFRTKIGSEQNRSWYIDGQHLSLIGEFFRTGRYPIERIMTIGGSLAADPGHVRTRAGAPLRLLLDGGSETLSTARIVVGGVFSGFTSTIDGYMGFYQDAVNLIDDGDREEPFGFIRPGYNKPSYSTAFLSVFRKKPFPMDCSQHGEVRACVNCGTCGNICPVDILPQFTMKCLAADELEEALAHGLLDCVECGLCTYACPSKIELSELLRSAKAQYYKEIA